MTSVPEGRDEWREAMQRSLEDARQRGAEWQIEVELFTSILVLLDGQDAELPDGHPYAPALEQIKQGIVSGEQEKPPIDDVPEEE